MHKESIFSWLYLLAGVCIWMLSGGPVRAVVVGDLYHSTLNAQSRSAQERHRLVRQGLQQVLQKVSGQKIALDHPTLQKALTQPGPYIDQFSYKDKTLNVQYSSKMVNDLLLKADVPIWDKNRPLVVMWLAVETPNGRQLIGAENEPLLAQIVKQESEQKGLPLLLPLLDLEDVTAVTVTDVWGQFPHVLQEASRRYGSDAILVGRVTQNPENYKSPWQGKWRLLVGDDIRSWSIEGKNQNQIIQEGIDGASGHLSTHFAVKPLLDSPKKVIVGIEDIRSVDDYARALEYLQNLTAVSHVNVMQVAKSKATFEITPKADLKHFKQALETDQNISKLNPSVFVSEHEDLAYRWSP